MSVNKRHPNFFSNPWIPAAGIVLVVAISLLIRLWIGRPVLSKIDYTDYPKVELLRNSIEEVCQTFDVKPSISRGNRKNRENWTIKMPKDMPVVNFHLTLQERINHIPARIIDAFSSPISGKVRLNIGYKDSVYLSVVLVPLETVNRNKGSIALILDDFGDRWDSFIKSFANLGINLTISVIPGRKKSSVVARNMKEMGCKVILHLPMEPISRKFPRDKFTILDNMDKTQILRIIQSSLDDVPGAEGVNNHMGSKVTQNRAVMRIILSDIKNRGLFFVDSRTTSKTVAYDVAKNMNMKCTKRDVFIDTEKDKETIRRQLWNLAHKAEKRGFAVGIGHARQLTLKVLKQEIEKIQALGFDFVFVSDILQ